MQFLHAGAGARGWQWRVNHIEASGRGADGRFIHLARQQTSAETAMVAVWPYEPLARLASPDTLRPAAPAAALACVHAARRAEQPMFGLAAADRLCGEVHSWQLAAALAFERGHARVLLADPAGMGKTVSAGLTIAQCLQGAADRRCLVLAPGHLLRQWRQELHDRLSIDPMIVDAGTAGRLQQSIPAGLPIWSLPGCFLASIDFLKQPHVLKTLEPAVWDLLVIDEAHLACGVSERRAAAHMIARRSRRVLLLTATPSDGGEERLHSLLSLGAGDDGSLIYLRHPRPELGGPTSWARHPAVERRLWIRPSVATEALHEALDGYTRWIAAGPRSGSKAVSLLCSLLTKRALSSAHAARISLERRLARIGREPGGEPDILQHSLLEPDDDAGVLAVETGLPVDRERRCLEELLRLAVEATGHDLRLQALESLLNRSCEPAIVFSCFRDTALLLARRLATRTTTAVVHGDLPPALIDRALDAFTAGRIRVLVATDVAAQGLNLHHRCRWVVHYDLPWRPSTVRQRLGRVDRLGQTQRAHATFLLDRTALASHLMDRVSGLARRMQSHDDETARRWRVLAGAEARRLLARRQPESVANAPPLCGDVTVVETELLDAAGKCLDRTVTIAVSNEQAAVRTARTLAHRRRVARRRALASSAERRTQRERTVLAAALEPVPPALRQDGLFDRRAARAREHDLDVRARLQRAAREATDRYAAGARIDAVRTRLVATFSFP